MFNFINLVLGVPLGFIMHIAYSITNSYGLAVIIFTVIVSILLYPVNVMAHKNSIRLLKLQPSLYAIKRQHAGDNGRLSEEQYNLFKQEKYSPFLGLVPLFLQLFLVIGMLQVMYHPLQHILHIEPAVIDVLVQTSRDLYGSAGGFGEQLTVLQSMQNIDNYNAYSAALSSFTDSQGIMCSVQSLDLYFFGVNFGAMPSFAVPVLLLVPLLSGITALVFCIVQSGKSPGALSQGNKTNLGLTIFTVAFSVYFAAVTPLGVGIYWSLRNIFGVAAIFILDKLYSPKKLVPEALIHIKSLQKTPEQIRRERDTQKELSVREKSEIARFKSANKRLVFYALSGGQYKYYKTVIEYILQNSDLVIHYLTNDPDDQVFQNKRERFYPYYISQQKTVSLLLRLDAEAMITTVPDLQVYHMKRSIVRDDIEYIYIHHGLGSTHLAAREEAYDHFDTIFCVGQHQADETRRHEELMGVKTKKLVKAGYGLYDQLVDSFNALATRNEDKPSVLIAPSWQAENIMDSCITTLLDSLLGNDITLIVRPHPQYVRMFPERIEEIRAKYATSIEQSNFVLDLNFLSNETILRADILITDWSNTAFEFSYCTLKPSIFINTPMKILNPKYESYGIAALEISLRDRVGRSIDVQDITDIKNIMIEMIKHKENYKEKIEQVVTEYLYYPGRSGEAGGRYIINNLKN